MSAPIDPSLGAARLAYFTPVREYPPLADRKASVLLAANGLLVTVLMTFSGPIEGIILGPRRWAVFLLASILFPLASLLLFGAWNAFRALTCPIPPMPDSLAFYPHIAKHSPRDYSERVKALDATRAVEAMLNYNYSLAILSITKFHLIARSISCIRSTIALWMILLLMVLLLG